MLLLATLFCSVAQSQKQLWVGEKYQCFIQDYGNTSYTWTNISWDISSGLHEEYSGSYVRTVSFDKYVSGTEKVTAKWLEVDFSSDYTPNYHKSHTWTFTCKDNPIELEKNSITITEGNTAKIGYSHKYSNSYTSNAKVTFSSNNTSVATVNSSGLVTAKSKGTAKITVNSTISQYSETCTITVKSNEIKVTSVSLDKTSLSLEVGKTYTLYENVLPTNATDKSVTWSTSNSSVATVSSTGLVTAKSEGTATITCKANDDSGKQATCKVTVTKPEGIEINAENFPDEIFRNYLLDQDYGKDGVLTEKEISNITSIAVNDLGLKSLKGLEYFTNLRTLNCNNNQLSTLDLSKNAALESLDCGINQLTELDVSKNIALWNLQCNKNSLSTLNLSNNIELTSLNCCLNQLTVLNLFNNKEIHRISCLCNKIVGEGMDALINSLPQNTTNDLHRINVCNKYNKNADEGNVCTKKQVAAMKAKGWTPYHYNGTEYVEYIGSDDIVVPTSIEIFPPSIIIKEVGVSFTATYSLTPSNATTTVIWSSGDDAIASVSPDGEVTTNKVGTTYIYVTTANGKTDSCKVTVTKPEGIEINAENFPDKNFRNYLLRQDYGKDGVLTDEEIKSVTKLVIFSMNIESLKGIEFFTELKELYCYGNQLTSLDLSNNKQLEELYCYTNQIKGANMDALIKSLPQYQGDSWGGLYVLAPTEENEGNVCTKSQVAAAKAKGWPTYYWNGDDYVEYEGSDDIVKPTCISLLPMLQTVGIHETLQLSATIEPEGAETTLTWSVDDDKIAKVTQSGLLMGLKEGTAIITVTTDNGLSAECFVSVTAPSGINDMISDGGKTQLMHNLSGQRLVAPKKGINIVGGKKVVIK